MQNHERNIHNLRPENLNYNNVQLKFREISYAMNLSPQQIVISTISTTFYFNASINEFIKRKSVTEST